MSSPSATVAIPDYSWSDNVIAPLLRPLPLLQLEAAPERLLVALVAVAVAVLLSVGTGFDRRLEEALGSFDGGRWFWRIALGIGGTGFLAALIIHHGVLHGRAHTPDEVVYVMQARQYAAGVLQTPTPPAFEFFRARHMVVDRGRWFGRYHPGWSLLLAAGIQMGTLALNPVLGGVGLVLVALLGRRLYGAKVGLAAAGFGLVSPHYMLFSASVLSHTSTLVLLLAAVTLVVHWALPVERRLPHSGILLPIFGGLGLLLGYAFLTRPLTAVMVALPIVLIWIWRVVLLRDMRDILALFFAVVTFLPFVLGYFWYNVQLTSDMLTFPFNLEHANDRLGFGPGPRGYGILGGGPPVMAHTPERALGNAVIHLVGLSMNLFGWPFLSLLPALGAIIMLRGRRELLLTAFVVSLAGGYALYWDHSALSYFGPRYWSEVMWAWFILTPVGMHALWRWHRSPRALAMVTSGALTLVALGTYWPELLRQHGARADFHVRHGETAREAVSEGIILAKAYEVALLVENDVSFTGDRVYARDRGDRNELLLQAYPGSPVYRIRVLPPADRELSGLAGIHQRYAESTLQIERLR